MPKSGLNHGDTGYVDHHNSDTFEQWWERPGWIEYGTRQEVTQMTNIPSTVRQANASKIRWWSYVTRMQPTSAQQKTHYIHPRTSLVRGKYRKRWGWHPRVVSWSRNVNEDGAEHGEGESHCISHQHLIKERQWRRCWAWWRREPLHFTSTPDQGTSMKTVLSMVKERAIVFHIKERQWRRCWAWWRREPLHFTSTPVLEKEANSKG